MNKLLIGAAGLAILLAQKKEQKPTTPAQPNTPYTPPTPEELAQMAQQQVAPQRQDDVMMGVEAAEWDKQRDSWLRADWAAYFNTQIEARGLNDALEKCWTEWNNPRNPKRKFLATGQHFLLSLGTYKQPIDKVGAGFNVQWNSTPVYHNCYSVLWSGDPYWSCADWKTWHQKLEEHYNSTRKANQIWESAWTDSSQWGYGGYLCSPLGCGGDCNFIQYFASKGLNVAYYFASTTCSLSNLAYNIVEAGNDAADSVSSLAQNAKWMIPLGLVGWGYLKFTSKKR